ncbi:NAD kinase [Rhodococcus sp. X156]|uniref:NAD kinase n=1 Tax=Rhodococcus sp. X156 TaxID=2499145 RepID=UPI000FDA24F8|nr:NAD kinase [Rhodococcus sp. X156]
MRPEPAAEREVLLVVHTGRAETTGPAERVAARLTEAGIHIRVLVEETEDLALPSVLGAHAVAAGETAAAGVELVLVLGGDGTILRAAELARSVGVPVLGINLGRVGFLAEADPDDLETALDAVVSRSYRVEERMTLDAAVIVEGVVVSRSWALNEASVEKTTRGGILDVVLEVDDRPVSGFGCDGVLFSTPTGSTAYAFSAGGPVMWPDVEALLVVPSNAHALFARPLVVSPTSVVALEVDAGGPPAVLCFDSRRILPLPAGARVEVVRGERPLRLVRFDDASFTDRLVHKFSLPVQSWRGRHQG